MRVKPALFIARRILEGRKRADHGKHEKNYLHGAIIGVALAIVPLVVVLLVADGMIEGITARYMETATYHLQASSFFFQTSTVLEDRARQILSTPGVETAYAEIQGPGILFSIQGSADSVPTSESGKQAKTAGALLRAVEPSFLRDPGVKRYLKTVSGELALEKNNDILLGEALAQSLNIKIGEVVSVVTTRIGENANDHRLSPKVTLFQVRGILSSGYRELDELWAVITLKAGARILAPEASRSFIGIKVDEPWGPLNKVRQAVIENLSTSVNTGEKQDAENWNVSTWGEVERNLWKSFATTRALLLLIMALAVAVAAINVGSALIMMVLERKRDLAILKSTGASPRQLSLVFLIAGASTGGVGSILGIGLGTLVALSINSIIKRLEFISTFFAQIYGRISGNALTQTVELLDPAYYLETIPIHIDISKLSVILCLSLILCLLASVVPARRAAKLSPLEIFRKT